MTALLYIIRKTYGWGKHLDQISITRMAKETGFGRSTVVGALNDLVKLNVIQVEIVGPGAPKEMRVLDPAEWDRPLQKPVDLQKSVDLQKPVRVGMQKPVEGGLQKPARVPLQKPVDTKEKKERYKENIKESTKERKKKPSGDEFDRHDYNLDEIEKRLRAGQVYRPDEPEREDDPDPADGRSKHYVSAIARLLGEQLGG